MIPQKNIDYSKLKNCWLSPSGEIITYDSFPHSYVEQAWHENLAFHILGELWGISFDEAFERVTNSSFGRYATEELETMGYIRLHGFGGIPPVWILPLNDERILTKSQRRVIVDWSLDNNREYENCFAK